MQKNSINDKKLHVEEKHMSDLCLGTAQFGSNYGVNNQIGRQPTRKECFEMLDYAFENGITTIDTANAYGEAELILGTFLGKNKKWKKVKIISKFGTNILESRKSIQETITEECKNSLKRLSVEKLDGYLLHTPDYIYNEAVLDALVKLKQDGYIQNTGISIYDLKEGEAAVKTGVIDYIQLPYNILDQRGMKDGFIPKARKAGITIFTRSVFLQGLLLIDTKAVPTSMYSAIPYLETMDKIFKKYNVDKVSGILNFVKSERDINYIVFGVEKIEQLKEYLFKSSYSDIPKECIQDLKTQINNVAKEIIYPNLWSDHQKED